MTSLMQKITNYRGRLFNRNKEPEFDWNNIEGTITHLKIRRLPDEKKLNEVTMRVGLPQYGFIFYGVINEEEAQLMKGNPAKFTQHEDNGIICQSLAGRGYASSISISRKEANLIYGEVEKIKDPYEGIEEIFHGSRADGVIL